LPRSEATTFKTTPKGVQRSQTPPKVSPSFAPVFGNVPLT
jgi:hypothetical protein